MTYADRVQQLEGEGLTTSDAQAVADAEHARVPFDFDAEHPADNLPPSAGCLAELDAIVEKLQHARAGQVLAHWTTGEPIILRGLFRGKGRSVFGPASGLRWECPQRTGLFGRGIALYGQPLPAWAAVLPRVK